jgi:antitoxin YefM
LAIRTFFRFHNQYLLIFQLIHLLGSGRYTVTKKDDWESLQETLYLQSIPSLVESIKEAEQADDWLSEEDFLKALNGMED